MFRPVRSSEVQSDEIDTGARFTRALVTLTRTVWSPDCTFETAIASICRTAATALQVERVSIWNYDAAACCLQCLHAYDAIADQSTPSDALETLPLDEDDYIASFDDVRTLEMDELQRDAVMARSLLALRDYLQRHRIHGMLDAPAFVGGELQGVICHESLAGARIWSRAETTFAASMGDYVAMAFEIARRRRAEAEVEHLRLHDVATGLPNRDYMTELIRQRFLDGPSRRQDVLAIVHLQVDVSGAAAWSDGAPSVDTVMGRIAQVLRPVMGGDTELARTGIDGFSFLVATHPAKRTVIRLAEAILDVLESMEWRHADVDPGRASASHLPSRPARRTRCCCCSGVRKPPRRRAPRDGSDTPSTTPNTTRRCWRRCASNANCAMDSTAARSRCTTSPSTTPRWGNGWLPRPCCVGAWATRSGRRGTSSVCWRPRG